MKLLQRIKITFSSCHQYDEFNTKLSGFGFDAVCFDDISLFAAAAAAVYTVACEKQLQQQPQQ